MSKLYYGNGNCSIDGEGVKIKAVEIRYTGAISIIDKSPESYTIMTGKDGILIFPIIDSTYYLDDLFDYEGEFKIKNILIVDDIGNKVQTSIEKVMDYSELIKTNAEDMDTISEDLSAGYESKKKKFNKTTININEINNLNTNNYNRFLYNSNKEKYEGDFHIHKNGTVMSGATHTDSSQLLYILKKERLGKRAYRLVFESTGKNKKRLTKPGKIELGEY